jgi:hypothetical protein
MVASLEHGRSSCTRVEQPRAEVTGVVELLGPEVRKAAWMCAFGRFGRRFGCFRRDFSSWSAHCVEISSRTTRTQDEAVKKAENLLQNVRNTQIILLIGAR